MKSQRRNTSHSKSIGSQGRSLSATKVRATIQSKLTPSPTIKNKEQKRLKNASINRQKLTQSLDTYTLLIRSNHPIRCLTHNCNISIYCQTEQKLLCANCIFGKTQHKFHHVTPVDRCMDKIQKDVETMNRLIQRQLTTMKSTGELLKKHLVQQESDTHTGLTSLIDIYEECHKLLQESFLMSKHRIIHAFENSRVYYEMMTIENSQLIQEYGVSNMMKNLKKQPFKREDLLLFQHSICTLISAQKRYQQKDFVSDKRQVFLQANQQKKKILTVLELLKKLKSKQK